MWPGGSWHHVGQIVSCGREILLKPVAPSSGIRAFARIVMWFVLRYQGFGLALFYHARRAMVPRSPFCCPGWEAAIAVR